MAITFVGSNTIEYFGTGNLILSLPASVQGDLVVVFTACQDESKGGPPSTAGYTAIADLLHTTSTNRLHASYKFMGATPDTSVTIPGTGSASVAEATLALVFRGVSTTTPLDVAATTNNAGVATVTSPPITPVHNDCCIVIAASDVNSDSTVGSVSGYLPSPSVQKTGSVSTITVAAAYQILSGVGAQTPGAWSTWTSGALVRFVAVTIALKVGTEVDTVTVDKATAGITGKAIAERELVAVSKATISYLGKTIGIPDSSVESIFVDKYRMVITGQTVDPIDTFRAVTVTPAAVLYRGRAVTVRDVQFEDIPRYSIKGRGSGHWMETR